MDSPASQAPFCLFEAAPPAAVPPRAPPVAPTRTTHAKRNVQAVRQMLKAVAISRQRNCVTNRNMLRERAGSAAVADISGGFGETASRRAGNERESQALQMYNVGYSTAQRRSTLVNSLKRAAGIPRPRSTSRTPPVARPQRQQTSGGTGSRDRSKSSSGRARSAAGLF